MCRTVYQIICYVSIYYQYIDPHGVDIWVSVDKGLESDFSYGDISVLSPHLKSFVASAFDIFARLAQVVIILSDPP